jgi:hypothetical protein
LLASGYFEILGIYLRGVKDDSGFNKEKNEVDIVHQKCYTINGGDIMPTKKPRLNVVVGPALYKTLSSLAHKEGISLSLLARDLLKEALELHEDIHWNEVAQKRDKTFSYKKALSHKDVWK